MKRFLILILISTLGFIPEGLVAKNTEKIVRSSSSLVAGTKLADNGNFYVTVIYDTSTSSIVAVGIHDISNNNYTVVSHNGAVGQDSGSLFSINFDVVFYHPGFGQNVTARFNGLFNYASVSSNLSY